MITFRILWLIVALFVAGLITPTHSQAPAAATPASSEEVARLRAEIQALRIEVQQLRQAVARGQNQTVPAATSQRVITGLPVSPAPAVSNTQSQELSHWITTSSGKRHNSRCRWYQNSKGSSCRADEGVACLSCGG